VHLSSSGPENTSPVLLLHGGGVAGWMWNSLRQHLELRHTVLVPDLPGHGLSADEPYKTNAETVDALSHMLLRGGFSPVAVIGFSLGAQLAIGFAATHPELVERVMVVSAQAQAMPFTELTLRLLGAAAPLARNRTFAKLQARELFIPPELLDDYIATSGGISKATLLAAVGQNMRFVVPEEWSRFPGRTLVMVGREERTLMRASATVIHTTLPGSELEIVDRAGHGIPLQHPAWFNSRVNDWLALR
jgi:pimeloyl-ACP methyl ester carboxylesterase